MRNIKYILALSMGLLGLSSCEDFLNRPAEDTYNSSNFYLNDEQCFQGVNPLYNSPWFDFQRGWFRIGEILSGNYMWKNDPYSTFTVNGTDANLINTSYSLWAVNAQANIIIDRLKTANASKETINTCMGECLVWKAMSYFYLVRIFGAVPIVHNNMEDIDKGDYNEKYKVQIPDVYEYIVMTLEKAIELLPPANQEGRIDQYSAKALLAKVYLTRSGYGMNGERNIQDLKKAAELSKDVIDNSGRVLMENYSDIFRLQNNFNREALISWHWSASQEVWTCQNAIFCELGISGFTGFGDTWGGYNGPSVDLQDAFGEDALNPVRNNNDDRRKATMMMCGDKYEYFWQDKGGFDYIDFMYSPNSGGPKTYQSGSGANIVKHLYGNAYDHMAATGVSASKQHSQLSTHLLRLADVYLIYVESMIGNASSTTDPSAIDAFFKVRSRSVKNYSKPNEVTWDDVWKERRLELANEGDRWYDYVRLSYYDVQKAINEIKGQRRSSYTGLNDLYKQYYETGTFVVDPHKHYYDKKESSPNVTKESFTLPFPTEDVVFNKHLLEDPIHVDVRNTFSF